MNNVFGKMFNYFVMRKTVMYLNSIKPRYFMLLVYLFLIAGATSCRDDNFERDLTDESIQLSKAELIQQALSRLPQTRGDNPNAVVMVTIKNTVSLRCMALDSMVIHWGDDSTTQITKMSNIEHTHTYSDNKPSHAILIAGSKKAIISLTVDNNELIHLNVSYNENLRTLSCLENRLDGLVSTGCSVLQSLHIANNELSSLEVAHLLKLQTLQAEHNLLKELDLSNNFNLGVLLLGKNQIEVLDVSNNLDLSILEFENNPIESIDLSEHINLMGLNASYTRIVELDLSKSINLQNIILEGVSIETFNNHCISDTSFSVYSQLWQLNIAYTPFTAIDLSNNPKINRIDISGTEITQLDLSGIQIGYLYATRSKLTNLICVSTSLRDLYELRIERTPFEKDGSEMYNLSLLLPFRSVDNPGHLYSYSPYLDDLVYSLDGMNWLIN
ncbi:MAG: hypothetical protein OSJ36_09220 [Odoribacter sp.]|nr:hypothetical protein [Odoribacter sp.]